MPDESRFRSRPIAPAPIDPRYFQLPQSWRMQQAEPYGEADQRSIRAMRQLAIDEQSGGADSPIAARILSKLGRTGEEEEYKGIPGWSMPGGQPPPVGGQLQQLLGVGSINNRLNVQPIEELLMQLLPPKPASYLDDMPSGNEPLAPTAEQMAEDAIGNAEPKEYK